MNPDEIKKKYATMSELEWLEKKIPIIIEETSKAKDKEFIEMIDNRINYLKEHQIDSEGSRIRLIIMELEELKQKLKEEKE